MRVRLSDVAKEAGVHSATASRALNPRTRSRISDETVQRVLQAAAKLNYSPNTMAQGLAQGRSSTIGVVIGDLTVPLFPPLLLGIDDVTSAAGYTALIVNTNNDLEREHARVRAIQARSVEGLIVATSTIGDGADPRFYTDVAPTVFAVRTPDVPTMSSVLSDDAAGVHQLVDHLVSLGHKRIAHVAGPSNISTAITRLRAYREALFEHGIEFDPRLVATLETLRIDEATQKFGKLLDSGVDLTAVFAFNDLTAFAVYRALRERSLSCPDDVSVVGFNDMTGADLVDPPLTTVAIDHYEMGAQAARMMLDMLEGPDSFSARTLRLPVRMVMRTSTAPPRA